MTDWQSALNPTTVASHALVVGDPDRAEQAAANLEDPQIVLDRREYRIYTGKFEGRRITIASHGVGASGAAFIFELLFNAGMQTVIRAGTCGAMVADIPDGGIVIGTAAIREDGLSQNMVPMEFPAVADCEIIRALQESSRTLGYEPFWKGVVLTDGLYFPYPYVPSKIDMWGKLGAVAVEMEYATLLIQASIHKARAGGIFVSDGNIVEEPDPMAVDPDKEIISKGIQRMIEISLNALAGID